MVQEGLGVKEGFMVWKGIGDLGMVLRVKKGVGGQEGAWGQGGGSSLSKIPQHIYNNPKYFLFTHKKQVVFLTNH